MIVVRFVSLVTVYFKLFSSLPDKIRFENLKLPPWPFSILGP